MVFCLFEFKSLKYFDFKPQKSLCFRVYIGYTERVTVWQRFSVGFFSMGRGNNYNDRKFN